MSGFERFMAVHPVHGESVNERRCYEDFCAWWSSLRPDIPAEERFNVDLPGWWSLKVGCWLEDRAAGRWPKPASPEVGSQKYKYAYFNATEKGPVEFPPEKPPVLCPNGHLSYVEGPGKDPMCLIGLCEYAHSVTSKLDLKGARCSTCGGPWDALRRECQSKRCWRAHGVSGQ